MYDDKSGQNPEQEFQPQNSQMQNNQPQNSQQLQSQPVQNIQPQPAVQEQAKPEQPAADTAPNFVMRESEASQAHQPQPEYHQTAESHPVSEQAGYHQPSGNQTGYSQASLHQPGGQSFSGQPGNQPGGQSFSSQPGSQTGSQGFSGQHSNSQGFSSQPGGYQQTYTGGAGNGSIPPVGEPQNTEKQSKKKKPSWARKAAGVTAAAVLFGVVSGGVMTGVNYLGDSLLGTEAYYEIEKTETLAEAKEETASSSSGDSSQPSAVPAISMDVSAIVEKAMPSVVAINNTMVYQSYTPFFGTQNYTVPSSGSGIIIGQNDEELLIVTNNHVIEDTNDLKVIFIDETSATAAVKGTDAENDLAVIAVPLADIPEETMSQIKVAAIGDSDQLKVGEGVIAIGNALGYGQSVTVGYVSAVNREVRTGENSVAKDLLQTDAAINPGNSGGALLNMKGEVIGINAAKYSSTEVEGMGYAIPISKVQDIINDLMNVKTKTATVAEEDRGYLGIQGTNIDLQASSTFDMPQGVYVYKILEDGAAANSDLREKDIITKFDGQGINTMEDLQRLLAYYEKGDQITLTVKSLENGEYVEREVMITLSAMPESEQ